MTGPSTSSTSATPSRYMMTTRSLNAGALDPARILLLLYLLLSSPLPSLLKLHPLCLTMYNKTLTYSRYNDEMPSSLSPPAPPSTSSSSSSSSSPPPLPPSPPPLPPPLPLPPPQTPHSYPKLFSLLECLWSVNRVLLCLLLSIQKKKKISKRNFLRGVQEGRGRERGEGEETKWGKAREKLTMNRHPSPSLPSPRGCVILLFSSRSLFACSLVHSSRGVWGKDQHSEALLVPMLLLLLVCTIPLSRLVWGMGVVSAGEVWGVGCGVWCGVAY